MQNNLNCEAHREIFYYGLKLFGINMNIFKKHQFESKDIVEKKVFNIPYLITLNQIEEYEKNGIIYESIKSTRGTAPMTVQQPA